MSASLKRPYIAPGIAFALSKILVVESSLEMPERPEPLVRTKTLGCVVSSHPYTHSSCPGCAIISADLSLVMFSSPHEVDNLSAHNGPLQVAATFAPGQTSIRLSAIGSPREK